MITVVAQIRIDGRLLKYIWKLTVPTDWSDQRIEAAIMGRPKLEPELMNLRGAELICEVCRK